MTWDLPGGTGWYHLQYQPPGYEESGLSSAGGYGHTIWATSNAEARAHAQALQLRVCELIGIEGPRSFATRYPLWAYLRWAFESNAELDWKRALHDATFTLYLASSAGLASGPELLGDTGLMHEIVHCYSIYRPGQNEPGMNIVRARVLRKVRTLCRQIPGYWHGLDYVTELVRPTGTVYVPTRRRLCTGAPWLSTTDEILAHGSCALFPSY